MARFGEFDYSDIKRLAGRFQKALDERVIERWIREFLLESAHRAERKIKKRTPVDTGNLRRNWRVGQVQKQGNAYIIDISNNSLYASFVEYGHRAGKDLTVWVNGKFMATISMKEIEREWPRFMEKKQTELLNQLMNGR